MPRNPPRKTKIGTFMGEVMHEAVQLVIEGQSLRKVAKQKNLSFQTLARYVKKKKNNPNTNIRMTPNYSVRKIFTEEQEKSLAKYIVKCSQMFYGLPMLDCRKLAYEMAMKNNLKIPPKWGENNMAGIEWLWGFLRRHPALSLRTPEGCSLSRATSFNQHNVSVFFDNLQNLMNRSQHFCDGTRIYNLDETSTLTVQKPQKVIAEKGIKQVSKVTSGEKGTLVTTCCIVSASGNTIPPVMVFPRVHFKEHMLAGAPPGSLGLAAPSGWMNSELFIQVMQHFIKHSHSSKETPTLLIYDNHESHLSIAVLNLAKENGVNILTLPPHSTNKLQPLDVGVFKPFTVAYDAAVDSWMMQHPGKPLTIYEVAACVGYAHQKSLTPSNIIAAFKKVGVYPFDRNIFTEIDFLPSSVTDRPAPSANQDEEYSNRKRDSDVLSIPEMDVEIQQLPSVSSNNLLDQNLFSTNQTAQSPSTPNSSSALSPNNFVSPEEIRGYPQAGERKNIQKGRKKGRSMIATDTPEKTMIEEKSNKNNVAFKEKAKRKKKSKKKLFVEKDSSEDETMLEEFSDSSTNDSYQMQPKPSDFEELDRSPDEGDYVLIEFKQAKTRKIYYIGKIIGVKGHKADFEVSYLRKSANIKGRFVIPDVPDLASVQEKDIKMILPPPKVCGMTKRQQSHYSFEVDFSCIDIR